MLLPNMLLLGRNEKTKKRFIHRTFLSNDKTSAYTCMDIGEIPFDQAISCFANPLTTLAFIEIAQARNHKSILITAAASTSGKMIIRYGIRNNLDVICVVRKKEQEEECKANGAKYIFNSESPNFFADLRDCCEKLKCRIAFDAVSVQKKKKRMLVFSPNLYLSNAR